jgi:hypothetical protein
LPHSTKEQPMKIGVIAKADLANAGYRAIIPALALRERGHEVVLANLAQTAKLPLAELLSCDVVQVYRCLDQPSVFSAVDELRRRAVAITWDDDDDVRLVPPDSPGSKQVFSGLKVEKTIRRQNAMFAKADLVTTTSPTLAEMFRSRFGGPIEVIENYLSPDQYARGRSGHDGIVIGWVAAGEHLADVRKLDLTQMLRNVIERDERIRVTTAGVKLDLDPARYTHVKRVWFRDLPAFVAEFDIGIAPLADHPMSYARSNIKVKEYAGAGVPWVASARGPYEGLGTKAGGITISDEHWEQTLLDLAGSRLKRMRLRRHAESWAKAQSIVRHVDRWEAAMQKAVARVGERAA